VESLCSFSSTWARMMARLAAAILLVVALVPLAGCVTVRPEEKEYLAQPSMTFGAEGETGAQEARVFSNREASLTAGGASGGGCGCN